MDQATRILGRLCLAGSFASRWWALAILAGGLLRLHVWAQPQAPTLTILQFTGFFLGPVLAALLFPRIAKIAGPRLALLPGALCMLGVWWSHLRQPVDERGLFLPSFAIAWLGMVAWQFENDLPLYPWRYRGREVGLRMLLALPLVVFALFNAWLSPEIVPPWAIGLTMILPWAFLVPVALVHSESRPKQQHSIPWPDKWEKVGVTTGMWVAALSLAGGIATLLARGAEPFEPVWTVCLLIGAMLGGLVCLIACQPARQIGWVPMGLLAVSLSMVVWWICGSWCPGATLVCGFGLSLGTTAWLGACRPRLHTTNKAWLTTQAGPWLAAWALCAGIGLLGLGQFAWWWLALVFLALAIWAAWMVRRPLAEQILAVLLLPTCHIRASGPGLDNMPSAGPVLLVANHTTYTDPFWLGKAIPRRFIPMMTSVFYDLPGIKFLMKHVVEAIRVPAAVARRNAPEIDEASAILKQGGTVLIFPEGTLRRVEDPSTKLFGRGVAMLVQQNPTTTVIPVWIEGGWGAYFSYADGLPGQNKPRDKNRDIYIVFGHPLEFSEAEIADQRILRRRLRSEVHACRNLLGLEIPNEKTPSALGKKEDEAGAE